MQVWPRWPAAAQASSQTGPPPKQEPLVVYDTPITQVVTDYEDFPGRTDAIYTVEVRARVSGYLKQRLLPRRPGGPEGRRALPDRSPPVPGHATTARRRTRAGRAHSQRLNNEYRRAKILYEQGRSISREEFDRYAFDYAEAEAALSTAKANLDLAKLDLDWTKVTADLPEGVTGRLSRRMVDPGNLIKADDTRMTTIVSQDPLYVYFDVHEQAMLRIRRLLQEGKLKAKSEKEVSMLISLSDEKDTEGNAVFPHQAVVDFTDNRVDLNTGTLRFRAKLSNPSHLITPGLFVKVGCRSATAQPHFWFASRHCSLTRGSRRSSCCMAKDEKGEPYFIKDPDQHKPRLDGTGQPIPGYRPSRSMSAYWASCATATGRSTRESTWATSLLPGNAEDSPGSRPDHQRAPPGASAAVDVQG